MTPAIKISILDDDHVTRLVRFALAGPGPAADAFLGDFFAPEIVDSASVYATARGLGEGVVTLGPAADRDPRSGSDATIIIYRRGAIDRALIAASPHLRLIQRIGARAEGIDL